MVRVTHPFHPLYGEEFEFNEYRRGWRGEKIWFLREDGSTCSMPLAWCDLQPPDPYLVVGEGRAAFRIEDLLRLTELLAEVRR
ncbi:MAG: hypothetical protein GQ558_10400 [Thermoplasmata archaeon]|nr:hypothetical protein [Thermoplasmata archaeon]